MLARHRFRLLLSLLIASSPVLFVNCEVIGNPPVDYYGVVMDSKGNPIRGVPVTIFKLEGPVETAVVRATSSEIGVFEFEPTSKGRYSVVGVCPDDGRTVSTKFSVTETASPMFGLIRCPQSNSSQSATGNAEVKTANGLRIVTFDTPAGRLKVNVPDDTRAGDTISGTVIPEPKGSTEEERTTNRGVLNGYVVEIEGQKFPVNKGTVGPFVIRRLQTPTLLNDGSPAIVKFFVVFVAVDINSTPLRRERIPLSPSGAVITPDPKINEPFNIPPMGQQGRPFVITGPFDGNSSNTQFYSRPPDATPVTGDWNGSVPIIVAESPRQAVVTAPSDITGPMQIRVNENGVQTTGNFRNVGVNLTAPKTSLFKGEKTKLRVEVSGLQGIKEPVPLTLESKGVITMEGGMYQPLVIQPSQVGADGRYSTTRGITGVQAGGWSATATVVTHRFDVCLQDDSNPARVVLWNTFTGDYDFRLITAGIGKVDFKGTWSRTLDSGGAGAQPPQVMRNGCMITLTHNTPDGRVMSTLDTCAKTGNATVEVGQNKQMFSVIDRNSTDNTCTMP